MNDRLEAIARSPRLLIACDFDGVIAPITSHPSAARAASAALEPLVALARLAQTDAAIISGRARADLARLLSEDAPLTLVGSHGGEMPPDFAPPLPDAAARLAPVEGLVRELLDGEEGLYFERKPAGLAVHYRAAPPECAERIVARLTDRFSREPGVRLKPGKMVLELALHDSDKGRALSALRRRFGSTGVVFIGDDLTDEDAFRTLAPPDLAIHVGSGPTAAHLTIRDENAAGGVLAKLLECRRRWIAALHRTPIERLSILSDQRTIALIDPEARLCWMGAPRADSPTVFASLLGGPEAGSFHIAPQHHAAPPAQSYDGDSMILVSRWEGLSVTDYLDCSAGRPWQRAGRSDLIRVIEARVPCVVRFSPRPDFARARAELEARPEGLVVLGTQDPISLHAPGVAWTVERAGAHQSAVALLPPSDEPRVLTLRFGTANLGETALPEPERRRQTERFWSLWLASLRPPALAGPLVRRSALVLKSLCHGPTGAILAAGTTSLPEWPGGSRNWDYRYCWPRDASLAAAALVRLGNTGVAMKLLDWLLGILDREASPESLRPIYTVTGGHLPPEAELTDLAGYRASRPVRTGNAASAQVQLDVFGPIVDLIALMADRGAPLSPEHWRLVEAMLTAVERRWREPDHGIWELRAERRHHVYSKVMCWLAADRGVRLAEQLMGLRRPQWALVRDEIAADILSNGWSESAGAFTAAYGQPEIDASALHIGLSGLLPPGDPRFVATIDAVERELRRGPTVYRYRFDDGLPGLEGGFHICTGWLVESLALVGRHDQARQLFDEWIGLAGPTGMLPEQYDPDAREHLGNTPQAYSHLAVINAAMSLAALGG